MKEKILKLIKEHIITTIILLLYFIKIIQMYFSTNPLPTFTQLLTLLVGGGSMIVGTSVFYNTMSSAKTKSNTKQNIQSNSEKDRQHVQSDSKKDRQHTQSNSEKITYHKTFNVAGVTFNCKLNNNFKRQDILAKCKKTDRIHLQYFEYKNEPAYLIVLDKNNLDIGTVPAKLVPTIFRFKDSKTEIKFVEIGSFGSGNKMYAQVLFLVHSEQTNTEKENVNAVSKRKISYHRFFYLDETHKPCHLDNSKNRRDVIKQLRPDDKYRVENIIYCGVHAQIVVNERLQLDIGMVPQELGITFYQYRDRASEAIIIEKDTYQIKMQFIVYKE